jgi:nucleotide-binding universal stress UspA family protein
LEQILQHAKTKDVDLIILGNDKSLTSNSILAPQVANKAPCSVLSVPYEAKPKITKVVAGIDFSQHSKRALQMAIDLKSMAKASIECVHAYKAPKGYAQAELEYDEIMKLMKANAIDEFSNFLSSIEGADSAISCEYVPETDAVGGVRETLEDTDADLLILGTRGRSSAARFILGSVTEELLLSASVPIFAVKAKGENMDVLHALLSSSESAG